MKNNGNITLIHSQRSKMLLWGGFLIIAGIGFLIPKDLSILFSIDLFFIDIAATFLSVMALIGASLSIRCRHCGLKLVWYALSKKNIGGWLDWLLHVEECPQCEKNQAQCDEEDDKV